jgi:hypothetical protein
MRMRNQLSRSDYFSGLPRETVIFHQLLYAGIQKGGAAVRQILFPASIIQLIMLGVTLSYFLIPSSLFIFQAVSDLRSTMGISFAFLSMGLIAVFADGLRRSSTKDWRGFSGTAVFGFAVFGVLGLMTAIIYSLPLDIQFVTSRLAVIIWVLLLSAITRKG